MHHLSQQDLEPKVRRPHLARHRKQLAEYLRNPGLSGDQRALMQERLSSIGKPRVYRSGDPAPVGASDPGPIPKRTLVGEITDFSREHLASLPMSRLVEAAKGFGFDLMSTKAQYVAALENFK